MILTWLVLVTVIHGIVGPPVDKKAAAGMSCLLSTLLYIYTYPLISPRVQMHCTAKMQFNNWTINQVFIYSSS